MKNTLTIDNEKAVITFDPDINMFRGEFVGLNGGADFYATSLDALIEEGRRSLSIFLAACAEKKIEPKRHFSGKFNIRIPAQLHAGAVHAAAAHNMSLNEWITTILACAVNDDYEKNS